MSHHIRYDHQCPNCEALYIPYNQDIPCPRCGLIENERFDFIAQAATSSRHNFRQYGAGIYTPMAWFAGSFADHILLFLFQILDAHHEDEQRRPFPEVAREAVRSMSWGETPYLEEHVYQIACHVYDHLQQKLDDNIPAHIEP